MSPAKPITVLLADDHEIVRQGVSALLNSDARFNMVGVARNGQEAVEQAEVLQPDVILMDITMPVLNGLEATRQILAANPAAKIIILTAHSEDIYFERLRVAGAAGFLEKEASVEILTEAICAIAAGKSAYSPAMTKRLSLASRTRNRDGLVMAHCSRLTARESEVLRLVAEGLANRQVAAKLKVSVKTVEKHRQHVMDKLYIHNTAGLTRYAIGAGVIAPRPSDHPLKRPSAAVQVKLSPGSLPPVAA